MENHVCKQLFGTVTRCLKASGQLIHCRLLGIVGGQIRRISRQTAVLGARQRVIPIDSGPPEGHSGLGESFIVGNLLPQPLNAIPVANRLLTLKAGGAHVPIPGIAHLVVSSGAQSLTPGETHRNRGVGVALVHPGHQCDFYVVITGTQIEFKSHPSVGMSKINRISPRTF